MEKRQENIHETTPEKNNRRSPDGGWGWVVCCACFVCHLLTDGIMYSFGIVYVELLDYFKGSKGETAIVSSLGTGMCFLLSPAVAVLTNRFGCQAVAVTGSVIMSGSFIISIFAINVQFLYFSLGIMTGIGYGMIYLPSIVSVSQYFDTRRALATGIGVSGAGIGTFVFSPLTVVLIRMYAWQGAILIQAGLLLNCLACGLVYRPVDRIVDNKHDGTELLSEQQETEKLDCMDSDGYGSEVSEKQLSLSKPAVTTEFVPGSKEDCARELQPLATTAEELSHSISEKADIRCEKLRNFVQSLKASFDINIFKNVSFCMFVASTFFYSLGYYVPYVYLPDSAKHSGLDEVKASFLLSAVGVTNTLGRVIFGFISDKKGVNRLVLYATALVICGIGTCFCALLKSFEMLLVYATVFGTFSGVTVSLTSVILSDIVGVHRLADAFGVSNFFAGIASFAGPPLAGWLYDVSDNYLISYISAGAAIILSGAMLYFVPCVSQKPSGSRLPSLPQMCTELDC